MLMIPGYNGVKAVQQAINGYKSGLLNGNISEERLNDAVARILSVKLAIGAAKRMKG